MMLNFSEQFKCLEIYIRNDAKKYARETSFWKVFEGLLLIIIKQFWKTFIQPPTYKNLDENFGQKVRNHKITNLYESCWFCLQMTLKYILFVD